MYNMLLLFQTRFETVFSNFFPISSSQKTKKLLEKFVRKIKGERVFYNINHTQLITEIVCSSLSSLPLTFIVTTERATVPSLLRASQEYSPLSSSTTLKTASLLFFSFNRVFKFRSALSVIVSPSFFHLILIVSLLTMQVNRKASPLVSIVFVSGTTRAEAFPALKKGQFVRMLVSH